MNLLKKREKSVDRDAPPRAVSPLGDFLGQISGRPIPAHRASIAEPPTSQSPNSPASGTGKQKDRNLETRRTLSFTRSFASDSVTESSSLDNPQSTENRNVVAESEVEGVNGISPRVLPVKKSGPSVRILRSSLPAGPIAQIPPGLSGHTSETVSQRVGIPMSLNDAAPKDGTAKLNKKLGTLRKHRLSPVTTTQPDRYLQLGDEIVFLSEHNGMLFADGQVKKKAYILENWEPRAASSGDLQKSVFRIEPQMAYHESKAYRQVIQQDVDDDLFCNGILQRPSIPNEGEELVHVEALKNAAILEQQNNEVDFLRLRGQSVIYGSVVQLFNMYTKRYLSVNSRETCFNEPTAMPIEMERDLRRECLFRILPKFRIRADGEPVRCGDVVVFKSVATEAHLNPARFRFINDTAMLNLACLPNGVDLNGPSSLPKLDIREASISMHIHGWTMKLFRSAQTADYNPVFQPSSSSAVPTPDKNKLPFVSGAASPTIAMSTSTNAIPATPNRMVQGGKIISLYHKEKSGYLAAQPVITLAESTFEAGGLDEQKVQLLEYHFDPLNPQDGSSCLSMWQVEDAADPYNGEAVEWCSPIRLRHAVNNMYLSVRKEYDFDLENDDTSAFMVELVPMIGDKARIVTPRGDGDENLDHDPTVFTFVQVNTENTRTISSGMYIRIQHFSTGAWIHPVRTDKLDWKERTRSNAALNENQGFSSWAVQKNRYFAVATCENHMDDYFAISIAEPDLVDKFNFVHSFVPWTLQFVLQTRYTGENKNDMYPIKSREDRTLKMIMSAMIFFCTKSNTFDPLKREGTPILLHQTLLREVSIIDILLKFLKFPFNVDERFNLQIALYELQNGEACELEVLNTRDEPSIQVTAAESPKLMPSKTSRQSSNTSRSVTGISTSPRNQRLPFRSHDSASAADSNKTLAIVKLADIKKGQHENLVRIFRFIYRVLKQFLLGSEHSNQSHLADKFMIISEHIDLNVGAADTLMQLIDGNPAIVQKISKDQIDSFIKLLARDRNPSYVSFLIAMCYCDGVAMPAHQLTIAKKLLRCPCEDEMDSTAEGLDVNGVNKLDDAMLPIHLFRTRMTQNNSLEVFPATEKIFRKWMPLEDLCIKVNQEKHTKSAVPSALAPLNRKRTISMSKVKGATLVTPDASTKRGIPNRTAVADYFEATLKLYRALCLGQNSKVITLLTTKWNIISLHECHVGLRDKNLPDTIRALYGDLIRVVFIDRYPIKPITSDYIFPVANISSHPTFTHILKDALVDDGSLNANILLSIPAWLSQFLGSQASQISQQSSMNFLVLSTLRLTKALVNFGYIRDENSIKGLFRILMVILDGKTDYRDVETASLTPDEVQKTSWWTSDRFEFNELNQPIIHSKIEICMIMEQLIQLRLEMRTYIFLHYWFEYYRPGGKRAHIPEGKFSTKSDLGCGYANIQTLLATIMDETAYFRLRDILSPILLELLRYESPKLKQCAVRLLHRMFASTEEILDILKTAVVLNDENHCNSYIWIQNNISVFTENGVGTTAATDSFPGVVLGGITVEVSIKMKKLLDDLASLCIVGSKTTGPGPTDTVLPSEADKPQPDTVTQMVIRNLDIHSWVIQMLKNRQSHAISLSIGQKRSDYNSALSPGHSVDSRSDINDPDASTDSLVLPGQENYDSAVSPVKAIQSDLLKSAFEFLHRFADGNKKHLSIIFEQFDLLLDSTNPQLSGATNETCFACVRILGRLLSQSADICQKLSDHHVLQILELSRGTRWEYLQLLKCLIKVNGKILKRNQSIIMKQLLENRKLYLNLNSLLARFKTEVAEDLKELRESTDEFETCSVSDARPSDAAHVSPHTPFKNNLDTLPRSPVFPQKKSGSTLPRTKERVPMTYFEEVIFLMSECCEGRNYMMQLVSSNLGLCKFDIDSEQMCQTILSLPEILTMLNSEMSTIALKNALSNLLVTAYIEATGEEDNEKYPERLQKDKRTWSFLEYVASQISACNSATKAKHLIDPDTADFLFGGVLKFIESFFIHCHNAMSPERNDAYDAIEGLLDDLTELANLSQLEKPKCDLIVKAIRAVTDAGFQGRKYSGSEFDTYRVGDNDLSQRTNGFKLSYEDTAQLLEDKNVEKINEVLIDFLTRICDDPAIKAMNMKEFHMLASKFTLQVGKKPTSAEFAVMCAPTKSIIQYLEESANGISIQTVTSLKRRHKRNKSNVSTKHEDVRYDIKTLKILETLVTEQIYVVESIDRSRFPDKWIKAENQKVEIQRLLNQLGCTLMAERLLTSDRAGVFSASLRVLIVLLDGGNREIQNTLESYWLGTREERFFYCMHETIKKSIVQVRESKQQMEGQAQAGVGLRDSTNEKPMGNHNENRLRSQGSLNLEIGQSGSIASLLNIKPPDEADSPSVAGSGGSEDGEFSAIRSVMRLLQLLVEGHNFRIQEYMRVQPDNIKTFNLIRDVVEFLHAIVSFSSPLVVPVMIQVFDTLIDLSQGATSNQITIFQAKIVQAVNYILVQNFHFCSAEQAIELKGKAALTLLSLLEDDAEEETKNVFRQMSITLDVGSLLENLHSSYILVSEEDELRRKKVKLEMIAMTKWVTILGAMYVISKSFDPFVVLAKPFLRRKHVNTVARDTGRIILDDAFEEWRNGWIYKTVKNIRKTTTLGSKIDLTVAAEFEKQQTPDATANLTTCLSPGLLPPTIENPVDGRLSHGGFMETMKEEEHEKVDDVDSIGDESSPKATGFIYSMLIATLLPYMSAENRALCERSLAFNTFNNKTGRIEIVRELSNAVEKRLYTVLFPIPDICFHLRNYTKDRFLWFRKRNTPQEKVEDFVNQSQDIIYEIRNQSLVEENIWLKKLADGHSYWWWTAYILTFFINIGNMVCMVAPTGDAEHDDFSKCPSFVDHSRTVLGLIQIVFWILSSSEFMVTQLPLLVNRRRIQNLVDDNARIKKEKEQRAWTGGDPVELKSVQELQSMELTPVDIFRGFFHEPKAIYHATMVFLAVLGLQFPSLYAIHLLDFMYRDAVLQGVIASVTMNWSSLSKTVRFTNFFF
ncbi:hypothetical protein BC830DRAFT_1233514 [Chytriomyces sp. MP71]|nr:hypothetical protein BC830DRAFT_1233514 [Chytriomyces sp. MP71]